MSLLSKLFMSGNGVGVGPGVGSLPGIFASRTRKLPNDTGSYNSPVVAPSYGSPLFEGAGVESKYGSSGSTDFAFPQNGSQTGNMGGGGGNSSSGISNPPIRDPKTTADAIYKTITGGDIPAYSATQFKNPNPTSVQAGATASELNNARNDIATGTTDPYSWASKSGIPYTAAELQAIEKASAGIYDPAINSALARLDHAQKMEEKAASASGGGVGVDGINPAGDAWVKLISAPGSTTKISSVPANLKNYVAAKLSEGTIKLAQDSGILDSLNIVNQMLTEENAGPLKRIAGPLDQFIGGKFGKAATLKNQFDQIKGILALENRSKLKGSGAISDFESRTLEKAASSLGRNLNNEEFKKQLQTVRGVFATASGLEANVKITNPQTGESAVGPADRQAINDAISSGFIVEYQ